MDDEEKSYGQKAKEGVQDVAKGIGRAMQKAGEKGGKIADTFTGKRVESLVTEYSDLHTKVVLGLYQDVEVQSAEFESFTSIRAEDIVKLNHLAEHVGQLESLVQEHSEVSTQVIVGLRRDIDVHHAVAGQARAISLIALAISVVALVGMAWNAV